MPRWYYEKLKRDAERGASGKTEDNAHGLSGCTKNIHINLAEAGGNASSCPEPKTRRRRRRAVSPPKENNNNEEEAAENSEVENEATQAEGQYSPRRYANYADSSSSAVARERTQNDTANPQEYRNSDYNRDAYRTVDFEDLDGGENEEQEQADRRERSASATEAAEEAVASEEEDIADVTPPLPPPPPPNQRAALFESLRDENPVEEYQEQLEQTEIAAENAAAAATAAASTATAANADNKQRVNDDHAVNASRTAAISANSILLPPQTESDRNFSVKNDIPKAVTQNVRESQISANVAAAEAAAAAREDENVDIKKKHLTAAAEAAEDAAEAAAAARSALPSQTFFQSDDDDDDDGRRDVRDLINQAAQTVASIRTSTPTPSREQIALPDDDDADLNDVSVIERATTPVNFYTNTAADSEKGKRAHLKTKKGPSRNARRDIKSKSSAKSRLAYLNSRRGQQREPTPPPPPPPPPPQPLPQPVETSKLNVPKANEIGDGAATEGGATAQMLPPPPPPRALSRKRQTDVSTNELYREEKIRQLIEQRVQQQLQKEKQHRLERKRKPSAIDDSRTAAAAVGERKKLFRQLDKKRVPKRKTIDDAAAAEEKENKKSRSLLLDNESDTFNVLKPQRTYITKRKPKKLKRLQTAAMPRKSVRVLPNLQAPIPRRNEVTLNVPFDDAIARAIGSLENMKRRKARKKEKRDSESKTTAATAAAAKKRKNKKKKKT